MALSPTSSHGGGTFNGGTITQPLVIDLSGGSGNDVPLKVLASYNAQNVDFFEVTNSDVNGLTALGVDSSAKVYVKGRDTTHAGILDVKDASQGTGLNLHGDAAVLATSGYATAVVPPGALPTVALVSGAAAQISTARDVCLVVPFTGDGTNNAATLKIELSPHVTWAEVIAHSGYSRVPLGPMRLPNGKWVTPRANARTQAEMMEQVRSAVNEQRRLHKLPPRGIQVLSWARSWEHNISVGGAKDSQHLYFRACDISLAEIERLFPWPNGQRDFDVILNRVYSRGGLGQYPAGNRHCDCRGYRARWSSFIGW